ncbi:MAG TPA: ABC transporter substrate-binding protein [Streptosporangiaceae bacterium]|nr:ABC transporter substrate-binding protein [Streptosporangiaceae bacterium]
MRFGSAERKRIRRFGLAGTAVLLALAVAACSSSSSSSSSSAAAPASTGPRAGGSLTVFEWTGYSGDWPDGLDPATNINGAATQSQMDAIYGELFELGPNGTIIPDLATGYSISGDGKTITLDIRQGVKFTDGTPFNAAAVAWNIQRDIKSACTCKPTWPVTSVTAPSPSRVVITLAAPDGAFVDQIFDSTADWIASPTAEQKMGEKAFAADPVGAGPFEVVSDTLSSELVLKKNPDYWQKGRPYLDNLTFKSVGGDEAAYEAMLAGEGQVYEGMSTPSLIKQAASHFNVVNESPSTVYDLQLNTLTAPFNNPKARQAIYAATNIQPILSHIFANAYPLAEGFTGPGGLCNEPTVPGYQGYDPTLAKTLVAQSGLNKVTIKLGTIQNLVAEETTEALQTEWAAVGIHATIADYPLAALIAQFVSGKWQSMVQTAGAWDPAAGVGVGFRFESTSPFSGVRSTTLNGLLNQAEAVTSLSQRCALYNQAAEYIAKNYDGPFYFAYAPANVAVKNLVGPGITEPLPTVVVQPAILWEDVAYSS